MKKLLLLIPFIFFTLVVLGQSKHTLTAYDHYFVPDTLYILSGDTVELVNIGYHSATEVDSIDWVNNVASHNGGFYVGLGASTNSMKFTINTLGIYYNICSPHANMGMKSIIIVESISTNLNVINLKPALQFYPNPASNSITIKNTSVINIYSILGQILFSKSNLNSLERIDISFLPKGIYNVDLDGKMQRLIVQ